MKKSEIIFGILRIPVDFVTVLAALIGAYYLRLNANLIPSYNVEFDPSNLISIEEYFKFVLIATAVLMTIFAINRMYSLKSSTKTSKEIGKVLILNATWMMLFVGYFFIAPQYPFSRLILIYGWLLSSIAMTTGRLVIRLLQYLFLKAGYGKRKLLFIGANKITNELAKHFAKDVSFKIVGVVGTSSTREISENIQINKKEHLIYCGDIDKLEEIIKKEQVEEIIQTSAEISNTDETSILDFTRENHIKYQFVPNLIQVQRTNIEVQSAVGIPIISLKPTPLDGWGRILKRLFDITGALFGLIIFSPLFLIIAIAIKLDSKGTVIFKYLDDGSIVKRVGEKGELFNFYKFRSMYPNTHNMRYTKLADQNVRDGSPMVKIKSDPRVTRVGKFIRRTSLDELPSLWNVLKGEMSLVGPRPHLPEEVAKYKNHHKFVLSLKPGITGLAQVSGRSSLDFEKEVQLDTYYIEKWSIWLDIKIIIKTFSVVLFGKDANDV